MSDRERSRAHFLNLIAQPGMLEAIMALHHHNGSATLAELHAAGVTRPAAVLRSLAAAGQVGRSDSGTWDTDPTPDTPVALTPAGLGLANSLLKAEAWNRSSRPPSEESGWLERLRIRRRRQPL